MTRRRGAAMIVELTAALAGLAVLGGAVALIAAERKGGAREELRMSELEIAQNLLVQARAGTDAPLPIGWTRAITDVGPELELVALTSLHGVRLSTVRRTR